MVIRATATPAHRGIGTPDSDSGFRGGEILSLACCAATCVARRPANDVVKATSLLHGEAIDAVPLRVIKRQFGFTKTRYRGLKKNTVQLTTLFALSNLWRVRSKLLEAPA